GSLALLTIFAVAPACGGGSSGSSGDGGDGDGTPRADGTARDDGGGGGPDANSDECLAGTTPAMCNFFTGCGCDPTQKCSVDSTMRACAGVGVATAGMVCTADDQCVAGTACITYPAGGTARQCMTFCDTGHACPTTP